MSERLASANTGNYVVHLEADENDAVYWLVVLYTGEWASGEAVEIGLDPYEDGDDYVLRAFEQWTRGDLNVADLLSRSGFDRFTNYVSYQRPSPFHF